MADERKAISELSADELRREIAERLGWTDIQPFSYWEEDYYDTREVHTLRGMSPRGNAQTLVPDWPADPGAALALCLDMLDRLNAKDPGQMWVLQFTDCCVSLNREAYGGGILNWFSADRRDALGMSQAALAALRGGDDEH